MVELFEELSHDDQLSFAVASLHDLLNNDNPFCSFIMQQIKEAMNQVINEEKGNF